MDQCSRAGHPVYFDYQPTKTDDTDGVAFCPDCGRIVSVVRSNGTWLYRLH
jgi:hypothetical protein